MKATARASLSRRGIGTALVVRTMGALALAVGATYLLGLVFLLARGAPRLAGFAWFPTPLFGVAGEGGMRVVLALIVFGALGWLVRPLARRVARRVSPSSSWTGGRAVDVGLGALVILAAVAFRHHLPRFLLMLPSETAPGGGVGPQIWNTLYFAVLSTVLTLPVGIGASVYLARFAPSRRITAVVRAALDTLASLPSIVYGLFGFLVFVAGMKLGYSLFAGACVLALLNLPVVVGISEESLRAVPRELEEASLALGATEVQTVWRVSLPHAWPGILSALVLGVGRVFAESAPLIMTAGTTVSRATAYGLDPFRGGETLAVHLWYVNSSGLSPDRAEVSAGTAAVLVLLIAGTNALANRARRWGAAGMRAAEDAARP